MNKIIQEDVDRIIEAVGVSMEDFEGKTVFISGAAGFLGNYFLAVFSELNKKHLKTPCKVIAVDNYIAGSPKKNVFGIKDKNIIYVDGDISKLSPEEIRSLDSTHGGVKKISYIIHAAGIASPKWYRAKPIETIDGTVIGLRNLLNFAVRNPVASFLYFSTSEIYGNPHPDKVPTSEEYYGNVACTGPRSCYDESKRLGETMCSVYHRMHKIPVKAVRPFNVYGPGSRIDDDRVVPKFIYNALQGKELTVHLPSTQTRTFSYISDAMTGFFKALLSDRNGQAYNIGIETGETDMESLAELISLMFNGKVKVSRIECPTEYPQDQALRRCPNINKARRELHYDPKIKLFEGLRRTIEWSKEHLKKK